MEEVAERIRRAVGAIPSGSLASYGDIAELVGCHPRQVGRVLATDAADLCWWRVTNARGRLPGHLLAEARRHWRAEGIDFDPDADGAPLRRYRADPQQWLARLAEHED